MVGKNDTAPTTFEAKYLGAHSAFQKSKAVHLILTSEHLEIPEMSLVIPLKRISIVHLVKEEKFATSLLTFPWKKDKKFMMLTYEDENNFEENMVFDVDKTEEVKTTILSAKAAAAAGNR